MNIFFINLTIDIDKKLAKQYLHPRHKLPPIDIGYCMRISEDIGHHSFFLDTSVEKSSFKDILNTIKAEEISLIIIKPNMLTYDLTLQLADEIRSAFVNATIIVMGGVVTPSLELFINKESAINLAIMAEPEQTLKEILECLSVSKTVKGVAGICYYEQGKLIKEKSREFVNDLDMLPFPKTEEFLQRDYDFLYPLDLNVKMKFATMLTSRGCPFECSFCSTLNRVSYGKTYRARSSKNVVEEIETLIAQGVNTIYFCDDIFTADRKRVLCFCNEIIDRKLNIKWAAQTRADCLDLDLLKTMKKAGCSCLAMGLESRSMKLKKVLNKSIPVDQIEKVVGFCKQVGIKLNADFMIGVPGETKEDISLTLHFAQKNNFEMLTLLLFTPYPGTDFFEDSRDNYDINTHSLYGRGVSDSKNLEQLRKCFYLKYYFRFSYIKKYLTNFCSFHNFNDQRKLVKSFLRYLLFA